MRVMINSLKAVKLIEAKGIDRVLSEAIVEMASDTEVENVYSKDEVNGMLAQAVKEVLSESRREFDKSLNDSKIEFNTRFDLQREESKAQRADSKAQLAEWRTQTNELKSQKRWIVGLFVTVAVGFAANFSHLLLNLTR